VKTLSDRIARMEKEQSQTAAPVSLRDPALDAARVEMQSLKARRQDLDERIAAFQARVEMTPRTEQELATLTRDYQKLKDNYLALFNRKLEATMAEKLDERWKGEHFRILDPAFLPEKPSYPKRSAFVLVGILLGVLTGMAAAIGTEMLDQSIKSARELEALMPYPLFATFPELTWPQGEQAAIVGQEEASSPLVEVPKQEQNRPS
jgi:succinoglycan biosynthesis transport protein ExoP